MKHTITATGAGATISWWPHNTKFEKCSTATVAIRQLVVAAGTGSSNSIGRRNNGNAVTFSVLFNLFDTKCSPFLGQISTYHKRSHVTSKGVRIQISALPKTAIDTFKRFFICEVRVFFFQWVNFGSRIKYSYRDVEYATGTRPAHIHHSVKSTKNHEQEILQHKWHENILTPEIPQIYYYLNWTN